MGADALLQLDLAGFIQHAVPAVAISQIQSERSVSAVKYFPQGPHQKRFFRTFGEGRRRKSTRGTSGVSRAMRKYCGIRVSWVAEVIFRFL
jgi:hypothetical protein